MEKQSGKKEEECGICLDALTNPVVLPCEHGFCAGCLGEWHTKYSSHIKEEKEMNKNCPLCRKRIPPSKEMIMELKSAYTLKSGLEDILKGGLEDGNNTAEVEDCYTTCCAKIKELEKEIGDWEGEGLDYDNEEHVELPQELMIDAGRGNLDEYLDWLGPRPVDQERLNAGNPQMMGHTLMHWAAIKGESNLLSILLQYGADIHALDATGMTPLNYTISRPELDPVARLLLEWGAELPNHENRGGKQDFIGKALLHGMTKLSNLLQTEFAGRRCELVNMKKNPKFNGKVCVVEKYISKKGKYKIIFEDSGDAGLVLPENLNRRDRTPYDCGYYIIYEDGEFIRRKFATKEECLTYVTSLVTDDSKKYVAAVDEDQN